MRVIESVAMHTCVATCRIDSWEALLGQNRSFCVGGHLVCRAWRLRFEHWETGFHWRANMRAI